MPGPSIADVAGLAHCLALSCGAVCARPVAQSAQGRQAKRKLYVLQRRREQSGHARQETGHGGQGCFRPRPLPRSSRLRSWAHSDSPRTERKVCVVKGASSAPGRWFCLSSVAVRRLCRSFSVFFRCRDSVAGNSGICEEVLVRTLVVSGSTRTKLVAPSPRAEQAMNRASEIIFRRQCDQPSDLALFNTEKPATKPRWR